MKTFKDCEGNVLLKDVSFRLKLKEGYLLKIINNGNYEIHHENGNGYIKLKNREALIDYVVQINRDFCLFDSNGNLLDESCANVEADFILS